MSLRYAMNRTSDFETVREIKEKLCYIRWIAISLPNYFPWLFLSKVHVMLLITFSLIMAFILLQLWLQERVSIGAGDHYSCKELHSKLISKRQLVLLVVYLMFILNRTMPWDSSAKSSILSYMLLQIYLSASKCLLTNLVFHIGNLLFVPNIGGEEGESSGSVGLKVIQLDCLGLDLARPVIAALVLTAPRLQH